MSAPLSAEASLDLLDLTASIVAAHVENNNVAVGDLPTLIKSVHATLSGLGTTPVEPVVDSFQGAVSIKKSLSDPTVIISMIDGKPYKMLKRHLALQGLTPAEYRERYKLPADYPIVAPAYSAVRQALAVKNGLGRKPGEKPVRKVAKRG